MVHLVFRRPAVILGLVALALVGCGRHSSSEAPPSPSARRSSVARDGGVPPAPLIPKPAWGVAMIAPSSAGTNAVAIDGNGNVVVSGYFYESITIGDTKYVAPEEQGGRHDWTDAFLAKFDRDGKLLWSTPLSVLGDALITSLVVDGEGDIYVTGHVAGPTQFAGQRIEQGRLFAARLAPDGKARWVRSFGGDAIVSNESIVLTVDGNLVLAGGFDGIIESAGMHLEGPPLKWSNGRTLPGEHEKCIYLIAIDADGSQGWGQSWCAEDNEVNLFGLAVDAAGLVYVAGLFKGTLKIGDVRLSAVEKGRSFLAAVSSTGEYKWSIQSGDELTISAMVGGAQQGVVVAASLRNGGRPFGSEPVESNGLDDVVSMWLGEAGVRQSYAFGTRDADGAQSIAFGPQSVVLGGYFTNATERHLQVGPGLRLPGHYLEDGFVVGLDQNLERPLWGYAIGGEGRADVVRAVAAAPDGTVVTVGQFQDTVKIGSVTLKAPTSEYEPVEAYVILFRPD